MSTPVIIMAAPNGARRTKADHPALPLTIEETVEAAVACHGAGAAMLHAHVRDRSGGHVLDAGLYRELIAEMKSRAPDMIVQITTEAVGIYEPAAQMALVRDVQPEAVSIALREIAPDPEGQAEALSFFAEMGEAGVHVQHILYDVHDCELLRKLIDSEEIEPDCCALLVLGRYSDGQRADPAELASMRRALPAGVVWFCCAFGPAENAAITEAMRHGGHARIGFENNLHLTDGTLAPENAALVREAVQSAQAAGRPLADAAAARKLLRLPLP